MPKPVPLVPRSEKAWKDECRALIHELEDSAPRGYEGVAVAPYFAQQSGSVAENGRPYPTTRLDVIERPFEFKGSRLVVVRLTRVAFVNLLRAMREVPTIEVGFGNGFFAILRTFEMQSRLHQNFLRGGPLAAPPGKTWHHRAAVDLGVRSDAGRAAMIRHGFFDLLPQDPPHFHVWKTRMRRKSRNRGSFPKGRESELVVRASADTGMEATTPPGVVLRAARSKFLPQAARLDTCARR